MGKYILQMKHINRKYRKCNEKEQIYHSLLIVGKNVEMRVKGGTLAWSSQEMKPPVVWSCQVFPWYFYTWTDPARLYCILVVLSGGGAYHLEIVQFCPAPHINIFHHVTFLWCTALLCVLDKNIWCYILKYWDYHQIDRMIYGSLNRVI